MFFELLVGHAFADFAFQTDAMARGKNRNNKPMNVPVGQKIVPVWQYWLCAHGLIHGGMVMLITGSVVLGLVETIAHILIDFLKCENKTNPHQDQVLHMLCKAVYLTYPL